VQDGDGRSSPIGVDQSPQELCSVPSSLAHSGRCLGRLLRCDARTLRTQRVCCYEKKYLICAQDRIDMLIVVRISSLGLVKEMARRMTAASCTGLAEDWTKRYCVR
jgi:hypothetical protein